MNINDFFIGLDKSIKANFFKYDKYYDFQAKDFHSLKPIIGEVVVCLILGHNHAAITLTNYLLERLLKSALARNDAGRGPFEAEVWKNAYEEGVRKYQSKNLWDTVKYSNGQGLLTDSEKKYILEEIKEPMRNGFSHADHSKILLNVPEHIPAFKGNIKTFNSDGLSEILLPKDHPVIQDIITNTFAKENAGPYFDFVYNLIHNISERLNSKP